VIGYVRRHAQGPYLVGTRRANREPVRVPHDEPDPRPVPFRGRSDQLFDEVDAHDPAPDEPGESFGGPADPAPHVDDQVFSAGPRKVRDPLDHLGWTGPVLRA
jgi:hypothetical protein